MPSREQFRATLRLTVGIVAGVLLVSLIFVASYTMAQGALAPPKGYDIASLLLAAAALSLFVLSILIAIATVFGWRAIQIHLSEEIARQMASHEARFQGMIKFTQGLELPRFRGRPMIGGRGVHDGPETSSCVCVGVPPADSGVGARWSGARGAGPGV
jgi:hypothetical protein